jgi:hypothetical protein
MIKNELEYNTTKNWVEGMGQAITMLEQDDHNLAGA